MPAIRWTTVPVLIRAFWIVVLLLSAQDTNAQREKPEFRGPLEEAKNLKTYFFTPQHLDLMSLYRLADQLYGRNIWLVDRGGYDEAPVRNLQRLGETLVIYDTDEQATLIGSALQGLDAQAKDGRKQQTTAVAVAEWTPGYISLQAGLAAIENFKRTVRTVDDFGEMSESWNIAVSSERSVIVLRDSPESIQQMISLLERLDVPEPQLLLTCLVITGVHGEVPQASVPPAELTANLKQLVPFEGFEVVSRGIVRSSAIAHKIEMRIDDHFRLDLEPEAYDAETRSLTARCQFLGIEGFGFETRTTITAGEYTVLGATGRAPIFAVLQIQPLD